MAKVYTKIGDLGCSIMCSMNLDKDSPIIDSLGAIDELQSAIDISRIYVPDSYKKTLEKIQDKLRYLAGELAGYNSNKEMLINEEDVKHFEEFIDALSDIVPNKFVRFNTLPSVYLNEARVRTRSLERKFVSLLKNNQIRNVIYKYINRLSDLFFVLSYKLNS